MNRYFNSEIRYAIEERHKLLDFMQAMPHERSLQISYMLMGAEIALKLVANAPHAETVARLFLEIEEHKGQLSQFYGHTSTLPV